MRKIIIYGILLLISSLFIVSAGTIGDSTSAVNIKDDKVVIDIGGDNYMVYKLVDNFNVIELNKVITANKAEIAALTGDLLDCNNIGIEEYKNRCIRETNIKIAFLRGENIQYEEKISLTE